MFLRQRALLFSLPFIPIHAPRSKLGHGCQAKAKAMYEAKKRAKKASSEVKAIRASIIGRLEKSIFVQFACRRNVSYVRHAIRVLLLRSSTRTLKNVTFSTVTIARLPTPGKKSTSCAQEKEKTIWSKAFLERKVSQRRRGEG